MRVNGRRTLDAADHVCLAAACVDFVSTLAKSSPELSAYCTVCVLVLAMLNFNPKTKTHAYWMNLPSLFVLTLCANCPQTYTHTHSLHQHDY